MQTKHVVIPYYRAWATLPDVLSLGTVTKPLQTPPKEPYVEEYSEADLRSLALENLSDTLPGLSISPSSLMGLPVDFFIAHYLHVRYKKPLPETYYPLRMDTATEMRLSTSMHSLSGLVCMALTLKALLNRTALTIDPAKLREARNLALLLREVQYAIYITLSKYPTGNKLDNLIIGSYTVFEKFGDSVDSVYYVMFDETKLTQWLSQGRTIDEAITHWVANQTQPQ